MRHDLRLALRRVLHARSFSICVVLILAVGIGSTAAMFSVLNALSFKTLNLPDPYSLVSVSQSIPRKASGGRRPCRPSNICRGRIFPPMAGVPIRARSNPPSRAAV
jgi:hypothetical protein